MILLKLCLLELHHPSIPCPPLSWHNIDRRQNENLPVLPVNQNKRQHLHDSRVGVPKQMEIYMRNSILKGEIFSAREQHSFAIHM